MSDETPTGEYEFRPLPVDRITYQFEKAFRAGTAPDIDAFLQGDGPARWQLLFELIHSELELRLQAGVPARVADYLARFPALSHAPNDVAALLETEVKFKLQAGEAPSLAEYQAQYAALGPRMRDVFKKVGTAPPAVPGYEVGELIAQGGMGAVYRARQVLLRRDVALKVIRRDRLTAQSQGERFQARFRREAEAVAAVSHPNVVHIFDFGEADGDLFLAMELVDGPSLQKHLDTAGVFAPRAAAELIEKAARALAAVHACGIVHRDLKPDNILLTAAGEPKVADFGLAKPADLADGHTQAGVVVGTPEYMSPEQAAMTGGDPTPRADVYGLGAVLYAALTGRPPFPRAGVLETLDKVRTQPVVPARDLRPEVPRDLETVCHKCLEKDPARRYASAADLAADLRRWLAGEPIMARPVGRLEKGWKWGRRNPVVAGLLTAIVVVAAGGAAGVWVKYRDERTQKLQAETNATLAQTNATAAEREAEHRKLAFIGYTYAQAREAWDRGDAAQAHDLLDGVAPADRDWTWSLLNNWFRDQEGLTRPCPSNTHKVHFDLTGRRLHITTNTDAEEWDTKTWAPINAAADAALSTPQPVKPERGEPEDIGPHKPLGREGTVNKPAGADDFPPLPFLPESLHRLLKSPESVDVHDGQKVVVSVKIPQSLRVHAAICGDGDSVVVAAISAEDATKGRLVCYDLKTGKLRFQLDNFIRVTDPAYDVFLPSPKGQRLIFAYRASENDRTGLVKCVDLRTGEVAYGIEYDRPTLERSSIFEQEKVVVAFSADDRLLCHSLPNGAIVVLRAESGKKVDLLVGHQPPIHCMALSPDGSQLVSVGERPPSNERELKVWGLRPPANEQSVAPVRPPLGKPDRLDEREAMHVRDFRFEGIRFFLRHLLSRDRSGFPASQPAMADTVTTGTVHPRGWVVTGHQDGTVRVWREADEHLLFEVKEAGQPVLDVALSPDGSHLAAGYGVRLPVGEYPPILRADGAQRADRPYLGVHQMSYPGTMLVKSRLAVWNIRDTRVAELIDAQEIGNDVRFGLTFTATGKQLVLGPNYSLKPDADNKCECAFRDVKARQLSRWGYGRANDSLSGPFALYFDGEEERVAATSASGEIYLHRLDADGDTSAHAGHIGQVTGVAFHPDGPQFVSVGADRTIQVFDPRLRTPLLKLPARGVPVGVRFRDSRILEVTDRDGTVACYPTTAP